MSIEIQASLFKEKGYCIAKCPNQHEKESLQSIRKAIIEGIREEIYQLGEAKEISIDYKDTALDSYRIFYDPSRVNIEIIHRLGEFVEAVTEEIFNTNGNNYIYYRGHSSTNYKLEPSIYRYANDEILKTEDILYRDILSSKPHFFSDCNTTLERLVKMQHHGIPTRLLDLTENPLIALYFACIGNKELNGEVIFFNIDEKQFKYFDSDTVSVITNLSKCSYDFDISNLDIGWTRRAILNNPRIESKNIVDSIKAFNSNKIIAELVHFIREDKPYFLDKIHPMHLMNYTLVVKPKMVIDRIINQSGAFILFGINMKKEVCAECKINKKEYIQKIILIPKEAKPRLLSELNMFNINKSTIFGDMDNTAEYFIEKYK